MDMESYAFALLRELYNWYDSGGISGRAIKAQLLETLILGRNTEDLPNIRAGLDTVREMRKLFAEQGCEEPQLFLFSNIELLPEDAYRSVVIAVMQSIALVDGSADWTTQEIILEAAGIAFGLYQNEEAYRTLASLHEPYYVLSKGWVRNWLWDSNYGLFLHN